MHELLEKFKPYIEQKLVREVISPCKKLVLYNYTDKCTYEKAWDEVTLNARGTVYEIETGKIVARAFPKFFNFGELSPEKQKEVLASENFETYEKMDGSLGIIYYYDGEWRVNTRGSFASDQAIKGKELLDCLYDQTFLNQNYTFLVEIIYPENKIIVNYGNDKKLTLLAAYDTNFNTEVPRVYTDIEADCAQLETPKIYNINSIKELQEHVKTLDHTEEGYVVRLSSGERVKFKSADYLRVARIMNHMSPLAFWEKMENGEVDTSFLEGLPEEFREECDDIKKQLESRYASEWWTHHSNFETKIKYIKSRKEIALTSKEKGLNLPAMFAILDKKDDVLNKIIMRAIRPKNGVIN